MFFEPLDYVRHIMDEVEYLVYASEGLAAEFFFEDPTLQRAFVRSLEVIGEASKHLPPQFREQHPEIDWRGMAGMRDRLIHGYFGVDLELVWDVVQVRVPELRRMLAPLLAP